MVRNPGAEAPAVGDSGLAEQPLDRSVVRCPAATTKTRARRRHHGQPKRSGVPGNYETCRPNSVSRLALANARLTKNSTNCGGGTRSCTLTARRRSGIDTSRMITNSSPDVTITRSCRLNLFPSSVREGNCDQRAFTTLAHGARRMPVIAIQKYGETQRSAHTREAEASTAGRPIRMCRDRSVKERRPGHAVLALRL
jgi:hypothetical protein